MGKTFLLAFGKKIDNMELISSLQSMITDPSKEIVKTVEGLCLESIGNDEMIPSKYNYFIGQIVDKNSKEGPFKLNFIDEKERKRIILGAGFVDTQEILNFNGVDEKTKEKIRKNPDLALKIICERYGTNWSRSLAGPNSIYAILDNSPVFYNDHLLFSSVGKDNVCYKVNHNYTSYYCNSWEVLNYLGYCVEPSYGYEYIDTDLEGTRISEGTGGYGKTVCIYSDDTWKKPEKVLTERDKRVEEFKQSLLLISDKKVRDEIIQKFDMISGYGAPISENCERIIYALKSKNR